MGQRRYGLYWRDDAVEVISVPNLRSVPSAQVMAARPVAYLLVEQPPILSDILCHFPELIHCLRARAAEDTRVDGVANDGFDEPGRDAADPR